MTKGKKDSTPDSGREKIHFERAEREKLIRVDAEDTEGVVEISLRPSKIDDFVGQERVKDNLRITLQAAQKRKESLEHILSKL